MQVQGRHLPSISFCGVGFRCTKPTVAPGYFLHYAVFTHTHYDTIAWRQAFYIKSGLQMQASHSVLIPILSQLWGVDTWRLCFPTSLVAGFQSGPANGSEWQKAKKKQRIFFSFFASSCITYKAPVLSCDSASSGWSWPWALPHTSSLCPISLGTALECCSCWVELPQSSLVLTALLIPELSILFYVV